MTKYIIWISIIFLAMSGCNEACETPVEIEALKQEVVIERLEEDLFAAKSVEDVLHFLARNDFLKKEFLGSAQYPSDTILAKELLNRVNNPFIDTLRKDVDREFGDLSNLKNEFANAFAYLRNFDPTFKNPKIQTLVTGFGSSEMYVSDSLIIIGLDYYIGPEASFRPNDYPGYILARFQQEYIVPATMLILSDTYIATDYSDFTMLAEMIFFGKKYYFTQQMMPCTPDSLLIWYTGKELEDVNENQHVIWANFLQNELLYETDHFQKQKFLGERPNTYEISAVCPGRIGAWVGWEIVNKYMKDHPEVTLEALSNEIDAQKIFNDSNYKGRDPAIF